MENNLMLQVNRVRLGLFHLLFQFGFKILNLLDKLKKAVSFYPSEEWYI